MTLFNGYNDFYGSESLFAPRGFWPCIMKAGWPLPSQLLVILIYLLEDVIIFTLM